MKDLDEVLANKSSYDKDSQFLLEGIVFAKKELGLIESMKRTPGWRVMSKKIREELQNRISDLIKDDPKIQTLIALLSVADTRTQSRVLTEQIDAILPEA